MAFRNVTPVAQSDAAAESGSSVSVGTTSVAVLAANPDRVEAFICNDHASQVLYLALGATAVASKGIRVGAGQVFRISSFTGAINGIASGASTTVTVAEV